MKGPSKLKLGSTFSTLYPEFCEVKYPALVLLSSHHNGLPTEFRFNLLTMRSIVKKSKHALCTISVTFNSFKIWNLLGTYAQSLKSYCIISTKPYIPIIVNTVVRAVMITVAQAHLIL